MARRTDAHPDNIPGSFFVDRTCIDCGTCYQFAPETFGDGGDHAKVHTQPCDALARMRASMALVACPVGSIGTDDKADLAAAAQAFPHPLAEDVFFCGYTSEKSFGAWSYLIRRPAGNVLMDSPRAAEPLMKSLEALGGVAMLVLSHQDDVADHESYRKRFGCERVMHQADGFMGMERLVDGEASVALAEDLLLIPTPGHSAGSVCLLYRDFLFTGDHLWWNPDKRRLSASKAYNWHSWERQLDSLERLLAFDFTWVLPGHGSIHHAESPAAMRAELERALAILRRS
ncbi:MBL fold metallo-hydrolase [Geothrix sp.]|jgi:glyoxylase-like metal-dependent hydrolase (beta-lactamase superfamily II)|uniref:MBL fold metallo-hydrolase n=1 Tax=Geothrix sp. TaxID=1962974 RepID=UPI0025BDAFA2|nr:MBL fold metallo-hydrolase [Geothrix sp.]